MRAQRIRHRDCRRRSSRCGNPVFWVPACSQWLDEHRSTESQQDCRQLFQKLSTHLNRSTPTCPKSSSPCRPAKSRPRRRIASPTHSAPGLPATIISLRQSRVWVPACSQWLDEHRSTESQQDCRQLFQKLSTRFKSIYPYVPKIIKPMPSGEEPAAPHCEPNAFGTGIAGDDHLAAAIRVWVPACSQWLDEHRSTESQQDCRQLFQKLSTFNRSTPTCPKSSSPCRPAKSRPRAALRAQRIRHRDCRRRSSRCGNPVFGFLPARNGLMNTDRLSRNRIVDSFFKSCRHD